MINSRSTKHVNFKINEPLDYSAQIVELPNSQLFCYNPDEWYWSYPLIVDAKNYKIIKTLPKGPGYRVKGGVYYKNSVFLFGGNNSGADMDLAMKFNLNQNKWVKIPELISPSDSCSYVLYKDSIFICGINHTKLYKYDLNIDSYSGIDIPGIWRQIKKTLLYADSNLYIIRYNFLYYVTSCIDLEKNTLANIGNLRLPFFDYSFVKFSKGSIVLWLASKSSRTCYEFNLKEGKLEEFSKIEYF